MTAKKSKDSLLNMAAGFLDDRVFFCRWGWLCEMCDYKRLKKPRKRREPTGRR